jgi:hypothetical protein
MTGKVKIHGAPPPNPPKASNREVIKDQGSVPFGDYKDIPTPKNLGKGHCDHGDVPWHGCDASRRQIYNQLGDLCPLKKAKVRKQ